MRTDNYRSRRRSARGVSFVVTLCMALHLTDLSNAVCLVCLSGAPAGKLRHRVAAYNARVTVLQSSSDVSRHRVNSVPPARRRTPVRTRQRTHRWLYSVSAIIGPTLARYPFAVHPPFEALAARAP